MKSFQLLVIVACMVYALGIGLYAQDFDDEWHAWKTTHKKTYDDEREGTMRRLIWQKNLDLIVKHNLEEQRGLHSYRLGMNAFGDMVLLQILLLLFFFFFAGGGGVTSIESCTISASINPQKSTLSEDSRVAERHP